MLRVLHSYDDPTYEEWQAECRTCGRRGRARAHYAHAAVDERAHSCDATDADPD